MGDEQMEMWLLKPLAECSRDDLIACVKRMSQRLSKYDDPKIIKALAIGKAHMIMSGELGNTHNL